MSTATPPVRPLRWLGLAALGAGIAAVALALAGESAGARKAALVALAAGGAALLVQPLLLILRRRPSGERHGDL